MPSSIRQNRVEPAQPADGAIDPPVPNSEREKIFVSIAEAVAENGYQGTTVSQIAKRAGINESTFRRHFSSKGEGFLAAFDEITARLEKASSAAGSGVDDWPQAVRAEISAMLAFLASEPAYARLWFIEALSATAASTARFEEVMVSCLTPFLEPNRITCSAESLAALPQTLRETLAGGLIWMIYQQIRSGRVAELLDLEAELVEFVLTPYIGVDEARSVALGERYESKSVGDSVERLLQNADRIRARHHPRQDHVTAAELIRESRER